MPCGNYWRQIDIKALAEKISHSPVVKKIVDEMGGITLGGATLCDKYFEKLANTKPFAKLNAESMALRHWLAAAGYDKNGDFKIIIADSIQNC